MANSIRSTKSGCHWTRAELTAYNITIVIDDKETFLGTNKLPEHQIAPKVLLNTQGRQMHEWYNRDLINLLNLAMVLAGTGGINTENHTPKAYSSLSKRTNVLLRHQMLDPSSSPKLLQLSSIIIFREREMIVPGITMISTAATFFKIPVTTQLDQAVDGMYPSQPTIVQAFVPQIPDPLLGSWREWICWIIEGYIRSAMKHSNSLL
ncbi:hypothetical protein JB92DRAFT_2826109 [Gautieria morchelliformis]|nr:hypothetical protein JB92DRAFT_2826109 [Gautieria morchelliformis]